MTDRSDMPHLLFSIRPRHVEKIVDGEKTVELRRRFSDEIAPGTTILIYSTSPTRAIVGSAAIRRVERLKLDDLWQRHGEAACVDRATFDGYFVGVEEGYAILLEDVREFVSHFLADDLREQFGFVPPQSFMYLKREYYHLLSHERAQTTN